MQGIPFRREMVDQIVNGTKTVTRRLSGLEEVNKAPDEWESKGFVFDWSGFHFISKGELSVSRLFKPRYRVNQVVYVKEAWWTPPSNHDNQSIVSYRQIIVDNAGEKAAKKNVWKSPMFMPSWAARYFIRILEVRLERLQEITEEGAIMEGMLSDPTSAVYEYSCLWDRINPKHTWASNPWCWRIKFILTGRPE